MTEAELLSLDTVEPVNGVRGCAECGGLLCIKYRASRTNPVTGQVRSVLGDFTEPPHDVSRVLCASCGTVLWERE